MSKIDQNGADQFEHKGKTFDRETERAYLSATATTPAGDELVGRLREACAGGPDCKCSLNEAASRIQSLTAEVQRCHERLEIDHFWVMSDNDDQDLERVEVPMADRDTQIDGIACRDVTISELERDIQSLTASNEALVRERDEANDLANKRWASIDVYQTKLQAAQAEIATLREVLLDWVSAAEALAGEPGMEAHFHDVADATADTVQSACTALSTPQEPK